MEAPGAYARRSRDNMMLRASKSLKYRDNRLGADCRDPNVAPMKSVCERESRYSSPNFGVRLHGRGRAASLSAARYFFR